MVHWRSCPPIDRADPPFKSRLSKKQDAPEAFARTTKEASALAGETEVRRGPFTVTAELRSSEKERKELLAAA